MTDGYRNWRRRLDGEFIPIDPSIPDPGCYRIRRGDLAGWDAIQIWCVTHPGTGEILFSAARNEQNCPVRAVWPKCAETPVSSIAFRRYKETGKWPDDVKVAEMPDGPNIAAAPESERMLAAIAALEAEAIAWFELIGSKIKTQNDADKAANYAAEFMAWESRASKARKAALAPVKAQETTIDSQWKPAVDKSRDAKAAIKQNWLRPYLIERERERKAALADNERDPQTIIAKVKSGTAGSRASALHGRWRGKVVDYRHFLEWLLSFEKLSPHLEAAMDKIANEMVHARVKDIPGVIAEEEVTVV